MKQGGVDVKNNSKLRVVLQKARVVNMPNDIVERNIKKAASSEQADYFEMVYELYGHGGVGMIIEVMTDNKNRIASDMRIATNKRGGVIATPGSVTFNFDRKGVIQVLQKNAIEEDLFLVASDAGAEDFEAVDEIFLITTAPEHLYQIKELLDQKGFQTETVEYEWIPKNYIECSAEDQAANLALVEWLENNEDVDAVTHNMKID